jgi:hypothetical protein
MSEFFANSQYGQIIEQEANRVANMENIGDSHGARDRLAQCALSMGATTSESGRAAYQQLIQRVRAQENGSVHLQEYQHQGHDEVYVVTANENGTPGGGVKVTDLSPRDIAQNTRYPSADNQQYWNDVHNHKQILGQQADYIANLENNGYAQQAVDMLRRDAASMNAAGDPAPFRNLIRQIQAREHGGVHVSDVPMYDGTNNTIVQVSDGSGRSFGVTTLPAGMHPGYNGHRWNPYASVPSGPNTRWSQQNPGYYDKA